MSKLEVDAIEPQSGTTITIGAAGDTVNLVGTLQTNGSALPGDISSVVAGTGLSGGGTSGPVTLNIDSAQPTITSLGTITSFRSTGIDDNADALAITIDSSERVLIKTTDIGYSGFGDTLTIGSASGNNGMTLRSGTSNYGTFYFSDGTGTSTGTYAGKIQYNHSDNSMIFATNSVAERVRITTDGELLVGKTANNSTVVGATIERLGNIGLTASSRSLIQANRKDSDGELISFNKDNTGVGAIGVVAGDLNIYSTASNHGGLRFQIGGRIVPVNSSGASTDNANDLGNTNQRYKDLYLGGGIYVGGQGAANKLDDYEEGTWTPAFNEGSGDSTASATNTYTKVGRVVVLNGYMYNSNGATSGNEVRITGLPFSAGSTRGEWKGSLTTHAVSFNTSAIITTTLNGGHTYVRFTESRSGTSQDRLTYGDAGTGHFQFSITYITDA